VVCLFDLKKQNKVQLEVAIRVLKDTGNAVIILGHLSAVGACFFGSFIGLMNEIVNFLEFCCFPTAS
jgi:hypothetical protein